MKSLCAVYLLSEMSITLLFISFDVSTWSVFKMEVRDGNDLSILIAPFPDITYDITLQSMYDILIPVVESNCWLLKCQNKSHIFCYDHSHCYCSHESLHELINHGILQMIYPPYTSSHPFQILDILYLDDYTLQRSQTHALRVISPTWSCHMYFHDLWEFDNEYHNQDLWKQQVSDFTRWTKLYISGLVNKNSSCRWIYRNRAHQLSNMKSVNETETTMVRLD